MAELFQDPELHFLWMEVTDRSRSVNFYRETLGFPVQEDAGPFAIVHLGNTKLYLAGGQPRGTGVHIAISVPDIDAMYQRLHNKGLGVQTPVDEGWARFVELIDPHTQAPLCRLYPLDKRANADGLRRRRQTLSSAPTPPGDPTPPLLRQLLADYADTGRPPPYLPFEDTDE